MKDVAKYNVTKGVSTTLTFATPMVTLLTQANLIVHRSDTALSAAGVFAVLLTLLFMKDKIMEYFKAPSALVLSSVMLILILILESILLPMKAVCIATMIMCGVDEITFKRWYKQIEKKLPANAQDYKHVGFLFTSTNNLLKGVNNG